VRPRIAVLASLGVLALQATPARATEPAAAPTPVARKAPERQVEANSPPFSDGIFPCSGCHDPKSKVDATHRRLQFHDEQQDVLNHGQERWCLDCHDAQNRDVLRSAAGAPIPYTESYRLCGQCHGDKLRDWKVGIHGKRTGMWDGEKIYFLCVNCHNPHTPAWKGVSDTVVDGKRIVSPTLELIKPEPAPRRPKEMRP
jgi:cytochrome c553